MKSANAGVASSTSAISVTVTFPANGTVEFDAECRGEGTSSAWDKCIFSIDGVAQFTYGAWITGWNHYSFDVPAGEHTFTWKYTKDSSVNPAGDYFAVDNIVMSSSEIIWAEAVATENTEYALVDLTHDATYYVRVKGICGDTETEWSNTVIFNAGPLPTQTIALAAGWNWVSFNGVITLADLKAAINAVVQAGDRPVIKSQNNGQTRKNLNNNNWMGGLNSLDMSQMYRIQIGADCEIVLQGLPIDPADHPATIAPGANWIAYPLSESMSVAEAFSGFDAINGDVVKLLGVGQAQKRGNNWMGALQTLVPGKGYVYNSKATTTKTLVFPTPAVTPESKSAQSTTLSSETLNAKAPRNAERMSGMTKSVTPQTEKK